jgi:hypothetical protein
MGLTVVWTDCNGKFLETVHDPHNFLHRVLIPDDATDSVLAKIDWYGDTYFNYLQIPRFLEEWNQLERHVESAEEKALIDDVRRLAVKAQADGGLLRFVGD